MAKYLYNQSVLQLKAVHGGLIPHLKLDKPSQTLAVATAYRAL